MWFPRKRRVVGRRRRKASRASVIHYAMHKEHARRVVHERLTFWNEMYACTYNRVAIRNHRSRWGSCSSKKNLNFNYRIAFLPDALRDYIIVHELCHLIEFNHSPRFWEHVARAIPDWNERRLALMAVRSDELTLENSAVAYATIS